MRRGRKDTLERQLTVEQGMGPQGPVLEDGSRVAVIGGGPAGSLFSFFLKRMAATIDLDLEVDIFEARQLTKCGPAGCNHCGGIVSESLVQLLATEGINLPPAIVQRGIDSYVIHMDVGSVRIVTPLKEKRIAALHRGAGPRTAAPGEIQGLDPHLQELAQAKGVRVRNHRIERIDRSGDLPVVVCKDGTSESFDLVAIASGVNSKLVETVLGDLDRARVPAKTRTFICEFPLGRKVIEEVLGASMHVFLLDLPRLEFAALIPKGEYATLCLLGDDVDEELVSSFLAAPEVRACFPGGQIPQKVCHCFPFINVRGASPPYADRLVFIGDSGVARLYKDGIGSAYRTAKAAARTAVFQGISKEAFEKHFYPACRAIEFDNMLGRMVFASTAIIQKSRFSRRGMLRMTAREQASANGHRRMSGILWDVFTGSAPYRDVLVRSLHPAFVGSLLWNLLPTGVPRAGGISDDGRTP